MYGVQIYRAMFNRGRPFNLVMDLKNTVIEKWAYIITATADEYIENIQERNISVIKPHGENISY